MTISPSMSSWLVAGAAALALGACGGGGGSSSDDDASIRRAITDAETKSDPSKCERLATQRFLEQLHYVRGSAALRACREDQKDDRPADSVDIASVDVDGNQAEAIYTSRGGENDGTRATVTMLKQGDSWRFDRLTAIDIDRPRFERSMRSELISPPDAVEPQVADCAVRGLRALSDSEIEQAIVRSGAAKLLRPVVSCALVSQLIKQGLSRSQAECADRQTFEGLTDREVVALATDDKRAEAKFETALRQAIDDCGGQI